MTMAKFQLKDDDVEAVKLDAGTGDLHVAEGVVAQAGKWLVMHKDSRFEIMGEEFLEKYEEKAEEAAEKVVADVANVASEAGVEVPHTV